MRMRPRNQHAANASRYITPYQWIGSGPTCKAIGSMSFRMIMRSRGSRLAGVRTDHAATGGAHRRRVEHHFALAGTAWRLMTRLIEHVRAVGQLVACFVALATREMRRQQGRYRLHAGDGRAFGVARRQA